MLAVLASGPVRAQSDVIDVGQALPDARAVAEGLFPKTLANS
jgi:hypothetical protein